MKATLQEICTNHNESGIVLFPDNTAIICNWVGVNGIPRIFGTGIVGLDEDLNITKRSEIESWKHLVKDYEIIYDLNNDYEDEESDGKSELIEFDNGIIVIAPNEWN